MKNIQRIAWALASGILIAFVVSCGSKSAGKVWTAEGQLHTVDGIHSIKGVCYHPVAIGDSTRSFSTLTQDLELMNEMGVNTIRVYEPIASKDILDQISEAGVRVIMGFGYNQGGTYDIQSGTYLEYVKQFKDHPAILVWELGNEYNFHPEWFGGDIQTWYHSLSAAVDAIHAEDPNHPVATAHGEVPEVELLDALPNIDLWGLNVYRWDVSYTAAIEFAKRSEK
ncbi:MAG: hypothetical protein ACPG08_02985, partial [Flavobacteriales bacterium]